jgi:carboxyl-terminal processing protease
MPCRVPKNLRPLLYLGTLLVLSPLAALLPNSSAQAQVAGQIGTISPLIKKAIDIINRLYLHPDAVEPQRMLIGAIQQLEHLDPAILVTEEGKQTLSVSVGARQQSFEVDVTDLVTLEFRLDEVLDFIEAAKSTSEAVSRDALEQAALRGMLKTIDRHSRLFAGGSLDEFNTRFQGTLVGIGSTIGKRGGKMRVIQPFPDAPAGRAGLKAGDHITHVDGVPTAGLTVEDTVERIRGPKGLPVVLTIWRGEESGPRIFVLIREKVLVPSIESELLTSNIGLIRIEHFSRKTSNEFERHLTELQQGEGLRGLVIDLRGNTGGSMRHASRIVNYFVEEGTIIRTEGPTGEPVSRLTPRIDAKADQLRYNGPVAVLVDRRTASGAEIVAGALKMLDRTLTLGAQTYGKGTVQKIYPLRKNGEKVSMKLTVARYLLPEDTFINSVGVTPDILMGTVWLDPHQITLPDTFREPPETRGGELGRGGLDSRRNPGSGRATTIDGRNSAPLMSLLAARVLDGWDPAAKPAAEELDSELSKELPNGSPATAKDNDFAAADESDTPGRSDLPGELGELVFNDMALRLAHDVLVAAEGTGDRQRLVQLAVPAVRHWQDKQSARLESMAALRGIKLQPTDSPRWMARTPKHGEATRASLLGPPPKVQAELLLPKQLEAGEEAQIVARVSNPGSTTVRGLRAQLRSSNSVLSGIDFLIGDIKPGESIQRAVPISVHAGAPTRLDLWRLYLINDKGLLGGPFRGTAVTRGGARPEFALRLKSSVTLEDNGSARIEATIDVRNQGEGASGELRVRFGRPEDEGVDLLEQYQSLEGLEPGAVGTVSLSLRVRDPAGLSTVALRLRAQDRSTNVSSTLELPLPTVGEDTDTGWREPARVHMKFPYGDPSDPPSSVTGPFTIEGRVEAGTGLDWAEIRLGNDKVFSVSPNTVDTDSHAPTVIELECQAIPEAGPNRISVRAHTSDGVTTTRNYWVLGKKDSN